MNVKTMMRNAMGISAKEKAKTSLNEIVESEYGRNDHDKDPLWRGPVSKHKVSAAAKVKENGK